MRAGASCHFVKPVHVSQTSMVSPSASSHCRLLTSDHYITFHDMFDDIDPSCPYSTSWMHSPAGSRWVSVKATLVLSSPTTWGERTTLERASIKQRGIWTQVWTQVWVQVWMQVWTQVCPRDFTTNMILHCLVTALGDRHYKLNMKILSPC